METKKYSSFAAIDSDLEILKLEKAISYQKLILSFQKAKDAVTPENIVSGFLEPYREAIPSSIRSVFQMILPYVISYFINRKRGN
jgi:hypothetical protein